MEMNKLATDNMSGCSKHSRSKTTKIHTVKLHFKVENRQNLKHTVQDAYKVRNVIKKSKSMIAVKVREARRNAMEIGSSGMANIL